MEGGRWSWERGRDLLVTLVFFAHLTRSYPNTMPETGGVTVKDVNSHDFVIAYAAHLKRIGKIEVPKWADLVKTAAFKELAPYDQDWYYIRAGGPWPSRDSPPLLRPAYAAPRPPPVPGCGRSLRCAACLAPLCGARDRPLPDLRGPPSGRAAAWVGRLGGQGMRPSALSLPGG